MKDCLPTVSTYLRGNLSQTVWFRSGLVSCGFTEAAFGKPFINNKYNRSSSFLIASEDQLTLYIVHSNDYDIYYLLQCVQSVKHKDKLQVVLRYRASRAQIRDIFIIKHRHGD